MAGNVPLIRCPPANGRAGHCLPKLKRRYARCYRGLSTRDARPLRPQSSCFKARRNSPLAPATALAGEVAAVARMAL